MDIWNLPQELRDIIYELVLTNGDRSGPSKLPARLDLVCKRIRSETRRLYHNQAIRATVLNRFWTPYPHILPPSPQRDSDSRCSERQSTNTIESKVWITIATTQNAKYSALIIALYMSDIMQESRLRVVEKGGAEHRIHLIGLDDTEEVTRLLREALERLEYVVDPGYQDQKDFGRQVRYLVQSWMEYFDLSSLTESIGSSK